MSSKVLSSRLVQNCPLPWLKLDTTSAIVQVASGLEHGLALTKQGSVHAWGRNQVQQLGRLLDPSVLTELRSFRLFQQEEDSDEMEHAPRYVSKLRVEQEENEMNLGRVKQITAGWYHSVAVTHSGQAITWGAAVLGHGQRYHDANPRAISSLSKVLEAFSGPFTSIVRVAENRNKSTLDWRECDRSDSLNEDESFYLWGHVPLMNEKFIFSNENNQSRELNILQYYQSLWQRKKPNAYWTFASRPIPLTSFQSNKIGKIAIGIDHFLVENKSLQQLQLYGATSDQICKRKMLLSEMEPGPLSWGGEWQEANGSFEQKPTFCMHWSDSILALEAGSDYYIVVGKYIHFITFEEDSVQLKQLNLSEEEEIIQVHCTIYQFTVLTRNLQEYYIYSWQASADSPILFSKTILHQSPTRFRLPSCHGLLNQGRTKLFLY